MIAWVRNLLVLALAAGLGGCGDGANAGRGSAGETTNGIWISGRIAREDGSSASRVQVELADPKSTLVYQRDTTDDSGAYALNVPAAGRYVVRGTVDSVAAVQWVSVGDAPRQQVAPLAIAGPATLVGKLVQCPGDPTKLRVRLPGLGRQASVGPDSVWRVAKIPAGWHLVQVVGSAGENLGEMVASTFAPDPSGIVVAAGKANLMPATARVSTLLDDFETDEGQGRLTKLLDGSWWGRWNDTSANFDSARTWAGTSGLSTANGAWKGKSLHATMRVGAAIASHTNLVRSAGLQLKIGGREDLDLQSIWFGLARVDSVVFMAKGSGTIEFRIRSRSRQNPSTTGSFRKSIVLTSDWTRHAIAASDFSADAGLEWKTSQAKDLHWVTTDPLAELWLDDIEITGLWPSDLLGTR
ncbi:MAG: carboxypeptidase regulatory-like domain-containing protein [Fibrobacteres bacterium]|nr:carboxypeptidase regulatory-like domain-containing protein [Fibrobacterota bacterium]